MRSNMWKEMRANFPLRFGCWYGGGCWLLELGAGRSSRLLESFDRKGVLSSDFETVIVVCV